MALPVLCLSLLLVVVFKFPGCHTAVINHGLDTDKDNTSDLITKKHAINADDQADNLKKEFNDKKRHRHNHKIKPSEAKPNLPKHDKANESPRVADSERDSNRQTNNKETTVGVPDKDKDRETSGHSDEKNVACPKCGSKDKQRNLRIELLKEQLLHKLGLSAVPDVKGRQAPLPVDFFRSEINDEADNEAELYRNEVKTKQVFIYGEDITEHCYEPKGKGCYSFNITNKNIDPEMVDGVELWIYKQPDPNDRHKQTFLVSGLKKYEVGNDEYLVSQSLVTRKETYLKHGWMKIYVKRAVLKWLATPHRNNGLAVFCKTCKRENHRTIYGDKEGIKKPVLVFNMKQTRLHSRRQTRSTACTGGNCCRMETLTIDFTAIGWDYIIAPASITPNFCTGSCNGSEAAFYNHTRVMKTLQDQSYNERIQPCCSPVAFARPQSLMYRDDNDTVRKIDIPDLIIGQCGCT